MVKALNIIRQRLRVRVPPGTFFFNFFSFSDSFIWTVTCPPGPFANANPWRRLARIANFLDTANYDDSHPYFRYNPEQKDHLLLLKTLNKGKLGKFKDEISGGKNECK